MARSREGARQGGRARQVPGAEQMRDDDQDAHAHALLPSTNGRGRSRRRVGGCCEIPLSGRRSGAPLRPAAAAGGRRRAGCRSPPRRRPTSPGGVRRPVSPCSTTLATPPKSPGDDRAAERAAPPEAPCHRPRSRRARRTGRPAHRARAEPAVLSTCAVKADARRRSGAKSVSTSRARLAVADDVEGPGQVPQAAPAPPRECGRTRACRRRASSRR